MKNIFIITFLLILITGCVKYDVRNDGVYYIKWDEARGRSERLIKDADQKTFELLNNDDYGKDKTYVFFKGSKIDGADPKSFKHIKGGYATDKERAYYFRDSISSASPKGFKILDGYFSRDHKNVFYCTKPLNVKSMSNFKFLTKNNLNKRWSTDGYFYWFNNYKIPSEDYENIVLLDNDAGFSKDSKNVYYLNRNIKFNDDGERILDTLDLKTFEITGFIKCRDKFGCINIFGGRKKCK